MSNPIILKLSQQADLPWTMKVAVEHARRGDEVVVYARKGSVGVLGFHMVPSANGQVLLLTSEPGSTGMRRDAAACALAAREAAEQAMRLAGMRV